jgi:Oxidoreductase molybdopterin binding domain
MRGASLDRLLAVLVVAMAATGLVSLRFGSPTGSWLFIIHGVLAGALAVAVALKLHASLPKAIGGRHWRRLGVALVVTVLVIGALVGGYAWVVSGQLLSVGAWTVLTLHAWLGLAVVPLIVVHLVPHRWRLLRPGASNTPNATLSRFGRRSLLVGGGLAAAGMGLFGIAQVADLVRGGERRFTGSRWLAAGGIPPATTFLGDTPPPMETGPWRISVKGQVQRALYLDLAELAAIDLTEITAILDCTSGWAIETAWSGVSLAALLDAAGVSSGARRVSVRSETGWTASFPVDEARRCLLATGVAGDSLPRANGAPVRLVAPDRRGLDWVKWVREVAVE